MKIQADTLRDEIEQIKNLVVKIEAMTEQIPGDDIPANDLNVEIFEMHLRAELELASTRLAALAEVIND